MSVLAQSQFDRIALLAQDKWGLALTEKKQTLVANRLATFLRKTQFETVDAYLDHLEGEATEEELLVFFDLLSTNVTSFFRDQPHFDYLEREFYAGLARGTTTTRDRKIRIWSAACSTGEEPYSLAMHACEHLPDMKSWDVKVLGTDLSNFAVGQARGGVYRADAYRQVPAEMGRKYFVAGPAAGVGAGEYQICANVRKLVTISRLNLMEAWPFKGKFDVIFCRNVMIYFDTPTRKKLVQRFHQLLQPGGILAVGSAETLAGLETSFKPVQASVYRRA
jgi:chemotaxis protein methyltransferase CheR